VKNNVIIAKSPKETAKQSIWDFDGEYKGNDVRFANDETNDEFNRLLKTLNEVNMDKIILSLGRPSKVLINAGIEDKPMKLYGNKIIKKQKKHGFNLSELENLPEAAADPIAVFDNYRKDGNRSILTELTTKNGNFLVSVEIGKDGDIDFNIISSVFGKWKESIEGWLKSGYATYINGKKVKDFLLHNSALIAAASAKSSPISGAKINSLFELNKYFGEKLYIRTKNFKNFFGDWEKDPEIQLYYGAVMIDGNIYRTKTTVKRVLNRGKASNQQYSFEIQEMEMIEEHPVQQEISGAKSANSPDTFTKSISAANLLKNVESDKKNRE
jgi:uncharacterized pyridoxamine 5'-phosphate oxidase family protein